MNLKLTTLKCRPDLYDQTIELIERSLHYNDENHYEVDFHPLVTERNHDHCHILINEQNKVIAHIAFIRKELSVKDQILPVIFIGGVCVDKEYQGQGLSSQYFKNLIKQYKEACALLVLWSDLNDFYEKLGFYECGEIFQTGTRILDIPTSNDFTSREWNTLTDHEISRIESLRLNSYPSAIILKRSPLDWKDIKMIKSATLYLGKEAYFVKDKGEDLSGIIHEFGALDPEYFIKQFQDHALWIYDSKLPIPKVHQKFFTGLFCIGQNRLFQNLISEISYQEISHLELESNNRLSFSFDGKTLEMSHKDFLQALWGPNKAAEFVGFKSIIISGLESV